MSDYLNTVKRLMSKDTAGMTDFNKLEEDIYLDLFNPMLNIAFGGDMFAGFPVGKFISLAGMPGAGKSFIALTIAAAMQKHGYLVVWLDSEGFADNRPLLEKFDIDVELFARIPIETIEGLGVAASRILENIESGDLPKKTIMFVDSVGQLTTEKEIGQVEDGAEAVDMGYRAKVIKKVFNGFKSKIYDNRISFVLVQHMYQSPDMYKPDQVAGGKYLEYLAQMQLAIRKVKDRDADSTNEKQKYGGIDITIEALKHRIIKESSTVNLKLSFDKGLSKRHGIIELCPNEYFERTSKTGSQWYVKLVREDMETKAFGTRYIQKESDTSFSVALDTPKKLLEGYLILETLEDRLIIQNHKKKNYSNIIQDLQLYITPEIKEKVAKHIKRTYCYSNEKADNNDEW